MTIIPECYHCKNASFKKNMSGDSVPVCSKYEKIPKQIEEGSIKCEYHEDPKRK